MKVILGAAALTACATSLCSSAAAAVPSRLALMPLPKKALGADATAFLLMSDSGVDSNAAAASNAGSGVTAADLARYGRVTGYALDYARPATGPQVPRGLLKVKTIAELYRNSSTAAKGLVFWRGVTKASSSSTSDGVTVRLSSFKADVNSDAFGFELTYQFGGEPFGYVGDVVFRSGDMLGAVFVTATDEAGLRARTVSLANSLALRIKQGQAGKLTGPPVALPSTK